MKEFKTIEEQVSILESRGLIVSANTQTTLLRENYYSIVNGYKDPFLDKKAMQSSSSDVYLRGARFDWMYSLFSFDRELRQVTFYYLVQAEAALKTATVYTFCEHNRGVSDYLSRSSYCDSRDMLLPKKFKGNKLKIYNTNMNKLISLLSNKLIVSETTRPFILHYLNTYSCVPLWVLANDLTFGNMSHFYQLMKRGQQNSVCKYLSTTTERSPKEKKIMPHDVLRAYNVLVSFRNLCAHDERLYCASKDNDTYKTMLDSMQIALPRHAVNEMKQSVSDLIDRRIGDIHIMTANQLKTQLGIIG